MALTDSNNALADAFGERISELKRYSLLRIEGKRSIGYSAACWLFEAPNGLFSKLCELSAER